MRSMVKFIPLESEPKIIAGLDVSYDYGSNILFAGIVVMSYPKFEIIEERTAKKEVKFPYIPGLLSFRETPALLEVIARAESDPDVIFADGQGVAHMRFFGIASHIGVILDKPTIGVAKKLLVGEAPDRANLRRKGDRATIFFQGKKVGYLLVTKEGEAPVVVSVGHKITLEESVELTLKCSLGFKIPEPTRLAHIVVNEARKKGGKVGSLF
jgi:deoxyribonuclease V